MHYIYISGNTVNGKLVQEFSPEDKQVLELRAEGFYNSEILVSVDSVYVTMRSTMSDYVIMATSFIMKRSEDNDALETKKNILASFNLTGNPGKIVRVPGMGPGMGCFGTFPSPISSYAPSDMNIHFWDANTHLPVDVTMNAVVTVKMEPGPLLVAPA